MTFPVKSVQSFPVQLTTLALSLAAFASEACSADLERGARIFRSCAGCHTIDSDRSSFGPSLKGVAGRTAGVLNDYEYSTALKAAGEHGLVWTDENLATFLSKPTKMVPGTKMRFAGLWGFEIDDLIAFLKANP
ncbi:cytochrome c family protein (plasmid) [Rhizobium grahamii]|uniref:Cytochrome c family protein n=1 Tax=Rhizobium grahamii TaxID=1120045 RepID=A0A5Q0CBS3_9HYPH|nr:cytochrome c family protein [Rhizobium sp. BG6]QFY62882.1 cytochrome c family protein [Rhizobium grahamii]QRM53079.1 cytochrome c family protein [Rhizobium sp. BG6]